MLRLIVWLFVALTLLGTLTVGLPTTLELYLIGVLSLVELVVRELPDWHIHFSWAAAAAALLFGFVRGLARS